MQARVLRSFDAELATAILKNLALRAISEVPIAVAINVGGDLQAIADGWRSKRISVLVGAQAAVVKMLPFGEGEIGSLRAVERCTESQAGHNGHGQNSEAADGYHFFGFA